MSREIRRVPMDYEHPRDKKGNPQPMYDRTYQEACAEWDEAKRLWDERKDPYATPEDYAKHSFEDWHGGRPDPAYYRPAWPAGAVLGIQLWEDVSEGTPLSPVFPDNEAGRQALAHWAEENATTFASYQATAQDWYRMLFGEGEFVRHETVMPNGAHVVFM